MWKLENTLFALDWVIKVNTFYTSFRSVIFSFYEVNILYYFCKSTKFVYLYFFYIDALKPRTHDGLTRGYRSDELFSLVKTDRVWAP